MRAMRLRAIGGYESFEAVSLPVPEPAAGELLIRVMACGVCGHDMLARRGMLRAGPGSVLGHEIAGAVAAAGSPDLDEWVGRRVVLLQRRLCGLCDDCLAGRTQHCRGGPGFFGEDIPGGYAEYVIAAPHDAVPLPDDVDDVTAAMLPCGIGTGLHALTRMEIRPDEVLLVTGAGGGVGLGTVRVAARRGIRVIAATTSPEKKAGILAAGADIVLVSPTHDEVRGAAAGLGAPRGVDGVVDTTGAPTLALAIAALRPRGTIALVGALDGRPAEIPTGRVVVREIGIMGSSHPGRADLVEAVELVRQGMQMHAGAMFDLEDVAAAHAAVESHSLLGKAVLVP